MVVVGAGGAGLRASVGCAQAGLRTACITKVFPTRSHTVAAQGGISASLGNMGPDDWRWHMYDTVKGSDWLGDQDAIEYLCRNAPAAVYELDHWGVPFSRTEEGKIYQRPFGGMTTDYGKGTAQRTCAAADRTGHAILHTLYGQALKAKCEFFIEYFAIDLIRDERGPRARRRLPEDGRRHDPSLPRADDDPRHRRLWPRLFLGDLGAHLHRRRQRDGAARRPAAAGHGVRAIPPDRHLWRRLPHHRGLARRGRLSRQFRGRALHGALCALTPRISPRATSSAASMTMEIREGRGVGKLKDHIYLHLDHLDPKVLHERLPGISESARIFAGVDVTKEPIPVLPTVHYNMGGIPTNYHGEVLTKVGGDPDAIVPGLMALGEAACVSVHGANRLGSNSLIDLVVFGRAAGLRAAEMLKPGERAARTAEGQRRPRAARGSTASATPRAARRRRQLRLDMQRIMQANCAVFRTGEVLAEGQKKIHDAWRAGRRRARDRPLADLELRSHRDDGIRQSDRAGGRDDGRRRQPPRKPRRPCARGLPQARRRQLDEAHAGLDRSGQAEVTLDYRPVHTYTMSNEVSYIEPKARVY